MAQRSAGFLSLVTVKLGISHIEPPGNRKFRKHRGKAGWLLRKLIFTEIIDKR